MGFFDDCLAADAAFAFTDPDVFGEPVVYKPTNGPARTINAVVTRNPAQDSSAGIKQPLIEVSVANSTTAGIGSAEVNYGGDTVTVAERIGGPTKTYRVHRPSSGQCDQDAGMLTLELR